MISDFGTVSKNLVYINLCSERWMLEDYERKLLVEKVKNSTPTNWVHFSANWNLKYWVHFSANWNLKYWVHFSANWNIESIMVLFNIRSYGQKYLVQKWYDLRSYGFFIYSVVRFRSSGPTLLNITFKKSSKRIFVCGPLLSVHEIAIQQSWPLFTKPPSRSLYW